MIDIVAFWKYLLRFKWVVIFTPLVCLIITFFLLKGLPKKYRSLARISTGISDRSQEILSQSTPDYYQVSQQFSNLTEAVKAKNLINALSIKLILHDLEQPDNMFQPLSKALLELSGEDRRLLADSYRARLANRQLVLPIDTGRYDLYTYLKSMGYHEAAIYDNLMVGRRGETDQIDILFESESPYLSAFVVNTLSGDFISEYESSSTSSEQVGLALLDSVLREKEKVMNLKNAELRNYKSNSGVLNVSAQAEVLYKQVSEAESRRSQVVGEIESLTAAIAEINRKLSDDNNSDVNSSVSENNTELVRLNKLLELANQQYVDNGYRATDKQKIDSLQGLRSVVIANLSTQSLKNPQAIRQGLVTERNNLEIALSKARSSINAIDENLNSLRSKYYGMMPADAGVQNLEREADLAVKEYTEAMNRYNQASFENVSGLKLRMVERGHPGLAEPSKKILFLGLSGVASGSICIAVFLLLFMLDNRIVTANQLTERTGAKVLGSLNMLRTKDKDLRNIWHNGSSTPAYTIYQDLIRALRFELNSAVLGEGQKVLGITSLRAGEGKTFVASSLAYAFALIGKKVLLIGDGTADLTSLLTNNGESQNLNQFEHFLVKKEIKAEDLITVLNRNPNNSSILELKHADNLLAGFEVLRETFDIILIDIDSLRNVNKAKEWLMLTDKAVAVYKWGTPIQDGDKAFLEFIASLPNFSGWIFNQVSVEINEELARN